MVQATCSRCDHEADVPKINGVQPDLPGAWSSVLIKGVGSQVLNAQLCPWCSQTVRIHLIHARGAPASDRRCGQRSAQRGGAQWR